MSFSFRSLFRNLFPDSFNCDTATSTPETRVEVEMPPVKPPAAPEEPSCFAKGIVVSLDTEPEQWTREWYASALGDCHYVYHHTKIGITLHSSYVSGAGRRVFYHHFVNTPYTTLDETSSKHVLATFDRWDKKDQDRKDIELAQINAPVHAHFAHLGCPSLVPAPSLPIQSPLTDMKKKRRSPAKRT